MKAKLTRTYIKEATESDLEFLRTCVNEGDDQGIVEFFDIGWEGDDVIFEQKVEPISDPGL